jgi:hypothetical protein
MRISCVEGMSRKLVRFAFMLFMTVVAIPLRWLCSANPLSKSAENKI